jgi:sn-glycerol 3-phosphate transport system ATP-binding protein
VTHDQVEAMTLAERMIVMNAGRAEQVGRPAEVYSQPATTFVASFIGSPPMNLLTGRVNDEATAVITVDGASVQLAARLPTLAGRELILGIRPEHLVIGGDQLTMAVETVERLGAEHLIHGKLGSQSLIVRTGPEEDPAPGATFPLGFGAGQTHWFDPQTGARVVAA